MSVSGGTTEATNNGTASVTYARAATGDADSGWLCVLGWGSGTGSGQVPQCATGGWTDVGNFLGGSGTYNTDTGTRGVAAFWATGASPTAPTVTIGGSTPTQVGRIIRFQKTLANWALPALIGYSDIVNDTNWAGTFPSDPGAVSGDKAVWLSSYVSRVNTLSSVAMVHPGMTVGTPALEMNTATAAGRAARLVAYSASLTGGPSSGAPSASATASANSTGGMGWLNLHDYASGGPARGVWNGSVFVPASSYGITSGGGVFVPAASSLVI